MIDRYSRIDMARIWEPENKFAAWLRVEIAACEAWAKKGRIPEAALKRIKKKANFDIERIDDYQNSSWARALRENAAVTEEIRQLNEAEFVEYERIQRLKVVFLKLAFRAFLRQ